VRLWMAPIDMICVDEAPGVAPLRATA